MLQLILLLLWLPLAKWALPPGTTRMLLFYGVGSVAAWTLWYQLREARSRGQVLFTHPWRGMLDGLGAFALLVAACTVLTAVLPPPLAGLAGLLALPGAEGWHAMLSLPGATALILAGSVAEEWIFRVVLVWGGLVQLRLLPAPDDLDPPRLLPMAALVLGVNLYFALMHLPHPPLVLAQAFAGGVALSLWLLWRRSFHGIALMHALFNLTLWMNAGMSAL